ncbi:hypothetical protein GCM10009820_00990 [Leifsonia soli]
MEERSCRDPELRAAAEFGFGFIGLYDGMAATLSRWPGVGEPRDMGSAPHSVHSAGLVRWT